MLWLLLVDSLLCREVRGELSSQKGLSITIWEMTMTLWIALHAHWLALGSVLLIVCLLILVAIFAPEGCKGGDKGEASNAAVVTAGISIVNSVR
jgi:hypothetical protein